MNYPRTWQHKKTKKKLRVMPWWEMNPSETVIDEETTESGIGVRAKFGCLIQIGYLLENDGGVWLGVGSSAAEAFKDLGEEKKSRKRPRR